MRNLLALAVLIVIAFAVVGYYRGWYAIKENTTPDGHQSYTVDFDGKKIREDVNQSKQEVGEVLIKKD